MFANNRVFKMMFKNVLAVWLVFFVMCLLTGCYFFPEEEEVLAPPIREPEKVTYDTMDVKKGSIERTIKGSGNFISIEQKDLFFKFKGGRLKDIYVKTGDVVKKGDLIAELDTDNLVNEIKLQTIALKKAELMYEKIKTDIDIQGGGDKFALKQTELDVEAAQLKLDNLQLELEKSKLVSPIDGEVVYINKIEQGEYINAYDSIVRIADPSRLQLEYSGDKISEFSLGMKVDVAIDKENYTGEVVMTPANLPLNANGDMKKVIRIKVDKLPDTVELGDYANITLVLERKDNVIVLPRNIINNFSGRKFVHVLENELRVERDLEVGIQTATEVEVVKGLKEGEKVIAN